MALRLSLQVALVCVLIDLLPAIFFGWLLARRSFRGVALLDSVLHLPLVLPPVVTGYVLLLLLGPAGVLGAFLEQQLGLRIAFDWKGAVLASAVVAFPLMLRSVRLAISLVDRRLEWAAQSLGAAPIRVFLGVTLPLALPGLLTGAVLAFARSLGEFGATIVLAANIEGQTRTLPLAIYGYTQLPDGEGPALRLVLISAALAVLAMFASSLLEQRVRRHVGLELR
ncbi:MAG: molybdate ABC transporter permease subunit [Planctomycetota bacterium]|nr:MAG: molybdate ABC transporter permease subunit [Planctomycetota bacterium]